MTNSSRLPRILQRLTELGIAITAAIALLLLIAVFLTDADLGTRIEFTPDEDTYSLSSEEWGTGTITNAAALATFTDTDTTFTVLAAAKIVLYAVASIALLFLLRGILITVATEEPFAAQNTKRLRAIGILIPVFGFLIQGLNWATSLVTMDTVTAEGLHIEANLSPNLTYLFLGLVIVAIAEAFRHGTDLQTDADLTV